MGADFYPRLTASAGDDVECNRLVNEQAQVGLLLAGPGVIASLTLAPLVITLLYSAKFSAAVGILRWICLGAMLQVISWPMGFIIIAKAKRGLFVGCEFAWGLVSIALAWVCIAYFGLVGAGIAFFGSYLFHGAMLYLIVHQISGFRWSQENKTTGFLSLTLVAIVFCWFYLLPLQYSVALGIAAMILNGFYSLRSLTYLLTPEQIPGPVRQLLAMLGLTPQNKTAFTEFS
jgi:enterobacterial common antigen flippase